MITIEEFMTADPYTMREADSMEAARAIMTTKHIRHIPITDKQNHLLGLVTQRDVLAASEPDLSHLADTDGSANNIHLGDIMIRNVKVVHPANSLRQAALYLQEHKYGCLPVMSDHQLVGIITDSDFIAIAINLLEQVELSEDDADTEDDFADDAFAGIDLPSTG